MVWINGLVFPHFLLENQLNNVKLDGMNGLTHQLKKQNGPEKKKKYCYI